MEPLNVNAKSDEGEDFKGRVKKPRKECRNNDQLGTAEDVIYSVVDHSKSNAEYSKYFNIPLEPSMENVAFVVTEAERNRWNDRVNPDAQAQCVKAIGRLFIFKGIYTFYFFTNYKTGIN